MVNYILIFVATVNTQPTYLGTYNTEESCKSAIRSIYEQRISPPNLVVKTPQMDKAVDTAMKYQRDFVCIPK